MLMEEERLVEAMMDRDQEEEVAEQSMKTIMVGIEEVGHTTSEEHTGEAAEKMVRPIK